MEAVEEDLKIDSMDWDSEIWDLALLKDTCKRLRLPVRGSITDLKILLFQHSIYRVLTILAVIPKSTLLTPEDVKALGNKGNVYIAEARVSIGSLYNQDTEKTAEKGAKLINQFTKIQESLKGIEEGRGWRAVVLKIPTQQWEFVKPNTRKVGTKDATKARKGGKGAEGRKGPKVKTKVEVEVEEDVDDGNLDGVEPFAGVEEKDHGYKAKVSFYLDS